MSIGLFALWVGWPGGLALYACGRAARVMRRDELDAADAYTSAGNALARSLVMRGQLPECEQDAEPHQDDPRTTDEQGRVPSQRREAREPAREEQAREQERHAQAERVDRQQDRAVERVAAAAGQREDRGERRPDARRPADAEARAGERRRRPARPACAPTAGGAPAGTASRRSPRARRPSARSAAPETISSVRRCSVSASPIAPAPAPSAVNTAPKPSTNASGGDRHAARLVAEVVERDARDVREVGRHERPHAGREEGDDAGGEGRAEPDRRERDLGEEHRSRRRARAARRRAARAVCGPTRRSTTWPLPSTTTVVGMHVDAVAVVEIATARARRWDSASRPCARTRRPRRAASPPRRPRTRRGRRASR